MANERRERLVGQQGVTYANTVAEAMDLKLDADNPPDREKMANGHNEWVARCAIPDESAGYEI